LDTGAKISITGNNALILLVDVNVGIGGAAAGTTVVDLSAHFGTGAPASPLFGPGGSTNGHGGDGTLMNASGGGGGGITDASYDAVIEAEASLVAYYPTEETTGTTWTDAKGTNNGTFAGGVTLFAALVNGLHGASFNGSSGFASAPVGVTITGAFTIECIAETFGDPGSNNTVMSQENGVSDNGIHFIQNTNFGSASFDVFYGDGSSYQHPAFSTATYYAWTTYPVLYDFTYDGTSVLSAYANGQLIGSTSGLTVAPTSTIGLACTVGAQCTSNWNKMIGGKVAIYNAALTPAQINAHAAAAGL